MQTFQWFILFSCGCGFILIAVGFFEISWIQCEEVSKSDSIIRNGNQTNGCGFPVYAVYGHDVDSGYLKHVFEMFEYFGFVRGSLESNEWHVLWAHDYPFRKFADKLKKLKPHQKVNHFPGTGFITNKLDLAKTNSKYIPKAFQMPDQKENLLKYISKHPKKVFVQKSNDHRGIKIEKIENLNLSAKGTFLQEFVDNPLLVDGHKFDIGVYTIITSIEPLRVYIYNGDILFRFCPDKYYPFDPENRNKYVIGDDYLPIWEVQSLKKYFTEGGYSMKESFNAYLRSRGRNPDKMWFKIEDAIRNIILLKESSISRLLEKYASKRNFFEMVRFDFAVDDDLNVFIMEANMSPNLSSAHFPPNRIIYYQVLFNVFSLVGIINYKKNNRAIETPEVSTKNLMVYPDQCSSNECSNCLSSRCQLCLKCMSKEVVDYLKASYIEHNNRQDCKRIFPPSNIDLLHLNETHNYSPDNQLIWNWFRGKCLLDKSWC
ncbi:probable tubulin polyglutamylase ttll-15 [Planococcus citri]|uniref:probable tubulin polyglutamylase ttll-15 n=1 Tax=Planococcus citri TaxID=170843 RepID=UPI0031F9D27B